MCALVARTRTSLPVNMRTSHSFSQGPICLWAFSTSKPTPNQFGTSKIGCHELFVFSNDCTDKVSLSVLFPFSPLACCFWTMTRRLQLGDNTGSRPTDRKLTHTDQVREATGEGRKDNDRQKLNSPSLNFQAKNIQGARSRWVEHGLFTVCKDKTAVWNHNLKGKSSGRVKYVCRNERIWYKTFC